MKFKEFSAWCNDRTFDGCWSANTAGYCISILNEIYRAPFWQREKIWKNQYESIVVEGIIKPINKKMKEMELI
ncbi:MAG: hypothetical protein K2P14_03710 [Anaeroplasmataceae bacterium]|nr:hypothetical protein [Anaeroplasmataceae bacterium]